MAGAAVGGLLAGALVRIAMAKLVSALAQQAGLLWNFGKDLEDMKDHLDTISAVLVDAERQSVKEELVRLWLKRLKDAALDISDMLEDYRDTSDQAKAKMPGVLSCLPVSYKKTAIANRMKCLREKLRKIRNEIDSFSFKKDSGTTNEQQHDDRETTSYLPEEPVIGRDREKQEIINLLTANTYNDEIVIVPIYGLGGMGKSTLAQLVYNHGQFKQYDHRVWVYVSQDFNLNKIGRSIISQLQPQGGQQNICTQQAINQCLESLLCGKKVLIVLDDLWEERMVELNKLRTMLYIKNSNKVDVIVTTRKKDIAIKVCTGQPYKLETLEDEKCWEIIKRHSKFELKSDQEKMGQIGLDIAKKCEGVALAAQAVGFMLRSIDDLSGWKEINNNDIWNIPYEDYDVLPSLKLSYERMPPQLRICFSYCAIFPKGYNIIEDDLVQQWIALDFIEQPKGKEYINKLLGMSFLQISKLPSTSQEHVVRYTMHDLVHDLARLTVADEFKVFDAAPERNTHDHKYCRYSLLRNYDRTMKLAYMPPKLMALRFSETGDLDIPSDAFSFERCLRTLDFSECSGIMLPASIGRMKQLRCLIAPRLKNDSLPQCITELSKLQYLNINGSFQISALPESIGRLGCLKYLVMSDCASIRELPDSLGNLTNLEHLVLYRCCNLKAIPESLYRLTRLQYLNLSFCECLDRLPEAIVSLMDLQYLNLSCCKQIRKLPESMVKLQNLLHLDLSYCRGMRHLGGVRGLTALQHLDMSGLRGIGPHGLSDVLPNLTSLKHLSLVNLLPGGSDSFIPECIGGLTNLEHLNLSHNFGISSLPNSIGNLKRLHTLDLTGCDKLEALPESIGTLGLKSLLLEGCSDELLDQASSLVHYTQTLPLFKVRADDVFNGCSNLHLLEGFHVSELRIVGLENVRSPEEASKIKLSDKHNLSKLTLTWSTTDYRAVHVLEDKDLLEHLVPPTGLKSMCLKGYSSTSSPGWLMCINHHLINLISVELRDMPKCSNLPQLGQLPHLEEVLLAILPGINRIDREFCGGKGAFRRLSSFRIMVMEGLEEWNTTYSVEDGVEEFLFPVLDKLEIITCPRLRLKPCPPTFREGSIWYSDQVISSLEELDKTSHHGSSHSPAIKLQLITGCQSIRILHHFPPLRELSIIGGKLKSLPESILHLTSLESLTLGSCEGMSALPERLSNLSSLKSLVIQQCFSIKSLPSCIQQLTKLQKLEIRHNQELKEWCESEKNKAKLAHISNIRLFDEAGPIM